MLKLKLYWNSHLFSNDLGFPDPNIKVDQSFAFLLLLYNTTKELEHNDQVWLSWPLFKCHNDSFDTRENQQNKKIYKKNNQMKPEQGPGERPGAKQTDRFNNKNPRVSKTKQKKD